MGDDQGLTLYAYNFRSRAERVIWMLNELELPFKLIRLNPKKGESQTAEFKALNPFKKVPVLLHGEQCFTESLAIMEYVHTLNPTKNLVPVQAERIYPFRHIIYFMQAELENYLWIANQSSVLKGLYTWPDGTYEETMKLLNKNIRYLFGKLEEKEFLVGDEFSMADIYAHSILSWAKAREVEIPDHIQEYLDRLVARPGYSTEPLSAAIQEG